MINVQHYGIFGNDTIDDTKAFRMLLTQISGPATILFPSGKYIFSEISEDSSVTEVKEVGVSPRLILALKSNIKMIGVSIDSTILIIRGQRNTNGLRSTDFAQFWIPPGSSGISWENFTVQGDIDSTDYKYNPTGQNSALYFSVNQNRTTDCTISNCRFQNLPGFAVNGFCSNFLFQNNQIRFTGNGVNVSSDNAVNHTVKFLSNSFYNCEGIESSSSNMQVSHNNFNSTYGAISVGGMTSRNAVCRNIVVTDNLINDTKAPSALSIASGIRNCVVSNNVIRNSLNGAITFAPYLGHDQTGTYIVTIDSVIVSKNLIVNTTTINRPSTYAIDINPYCYHVIISENTIDFDSSNSDTLAGGIVLNPDSEVLLENNKIRTNVGRSITESSLKGPFNYYLKNNEFDSRKAFIPNGRKRP